MNTQLLKFAADALADGNLAASEVVCRDILEAEPGNAAALNLLGIIAARLGMGAPACGYFTAALALQPANQTVRRNLAAAQGAPTPVLPAGERYLLIKAWGFGFWSDVSHVLGALLLADITGRIPVIHWGRNSLFGDGSGGDAFRLYFEPVSSITLADLATLDGASYFPARWNGANLARDELHKWEGPYARAAALYFLNRPETIAVSDFYCGIIDVAPWIPEGHPLHGKPLGEIYRDLAEKYLRPRGHCLAACETFFQAHLGNAPYAAIHMRGSDKASEDGDLHLTQDAILAAIAAIDPSWRLFLLTDDARLLARMTAAHGDRVIATDCQRTAGTTGVHYLPTVDRVRVGTEMMTDTLLALRARRFIGNGRSNVSAMIAFMNDWPPGDCTLIGRNLLTQRNLSIHLRQ